LSDLGGIRGAGGWRDSFSWGGIESRSEERFVLNGEERPRGDRMKKLRGEKKKRESGGHEKNFKARIKRLGRGEIVYNTQYPGRWWRDTA